MRRIVSVGRPRLPSVTGTPIEKTDANTRAVLTPSLPKLDAEFEEITEGEEQTQKEKLKTKSKVRGQR